jgi:hypothetical protein
MFHILFAILVSWSNDNPYILVPQPAGVIRVELKNLHVLVGQSSWRGNGNRISWTWLSAKMGTE